MKSQQISILFVDDDEHDYLAFRRFLSEYKLPYKHIRANSVAQARQALKVNTFDVALLDYRLADGTAFDLSVEIAEDIPFVILICGEDEAVAVQAMNAGASDYLVKDAASRWVTTLPSTVHNAIRARRAEKVLKQAQAKLEQELHRLTEELLRANLQLQNEIKERKKAEETVELCEERLSTVAEITGDWLWEADADLRLTYVNLGVVELLGFEQSEILNRTPWDLTPDSETDRMEKRFREILDSRQAFRDLENLIVHKDGHIVALEFSGLPFFDALGQLYGYRGIIRNVSDRKS